MKSIDNRLVAMFLLAALCCWPEFCGAVIDAHFADHDSRSSVAGWTIQAQRNPAFDRPIAESRSSLQRIACDACSLAISAYQAVVFYHRLPLVRSGGSGLGCGFSDPTPAANY